MPVDEKDPPAPVKTPTEIGPPAPKPAPHRRRYVGAGLMALGLCAAAWLVHSYRGHAEPGVDADDNLALSVIGGWWNIVGDRHLTLAWEGHRATLIDYSTSDAGVQSTGTWHTTQDSVIVHVQGAAGALEQTLELVGNEAEMFLAPSPSAQARLFDSWIADHDDDAEDMSPSDSTAREARAAGRSAHKKSSQTVSNEYANRVVEASGDAFATRR